MGLSSSVFAVFAVDLGELPGSFWSALYEAAEGSPVECTIINDGRRVVAFARGSLRRLLDDKEVALDVLDVETLPRGKRNATLKPWRAALALFCQRNGVKPQEPRWLIVSDVS